jgi:hypothetical protein
MIQNHLPRRVQRKEISFVYLRGFKSLSSMLDVFKTETIEFRYMVIVERIIDLPPIFAGTHQFHLPQPAQLM